MRRAPALATPIVAKWAGWGRQNFWSVYNFSNRVSCFLIPNDLFAFGKKIRDGKKLKIDSDKEQKIKLTLVSLGSGIISVVSRSLPLNPGDLR